MATRRTVELVTVRTLSPSVRAFEWRCVDGAPLVYVPGQWVNFHVPVAGNLVRRAYSIATAPSRERADRFEIAVTRVRAGVASLALHELATGARIEIDAAEGFFTRESAAGLPALFVGTGTGVCPLRAMIEAELREASGPPLTLLFGCRGEADVLYREDFERWARERPRFTWHVTLSRPAGDWKGRTGYVQAQLASLVRRVGEGASPHVYVCGLQRMIREVRRVLKDELAYDRTLIHSERYD